MDYPDCVIDTLYEDWLERQARGEYSTHWLPRKEIPMTPYEEDTRKIQAENDFREAQGLTLDRQGTLTQARALEKILSRIRRPVVAKLDETCLRELSMRLGYLTAEAQRIQEILQGIWPPKENR